LHGFAPELHYNPADVYIVGEPQVVVWETGFRNRDGDWEMHRHHSWRYRLDRKPWSVDLPALYAEVAKTRPRPLKQKTGESTVVVCWADVQTGKVEHLGGMRELLERLDEKRAALDDYLKRSRFDRIVIADVGDIVEGFDNYPAQTRNNALSLSDQIDCASTEFWKTIRLCERRAPVDVLSVPSNHCQWRKGKNLIGNPGDDRGLHISKRLEKMNAEVGLRVDFHRPATVYDETLCFDIRGTRLGLAHRHQATRPDAIKTWWEKMTHGGIFDAHVLVTGHFHFASVRPHGRDAMTGRARWHVQATTMDNGSRGYVGNRLGEDGDPALTVFQINNDGFDLTPFALL
jgi:hypothetical protein